MSQSVNIPEYDAICIREAVYGAVEVSIVGFLMVRVSSRLVDIVKGLETALKCVCFVNLTKGLGCSGQGALVADKDKAASTFDFEGSVNLSAIQSPGSFARFP